MLIEYRKDSALGCHSIKFKDIPHIWHVYDIYIQNDAQRTLLDSLIYKPVLNKINHKKGDEFSVIKLDMNEIALLEKAASICNYDMIFSKIFSIKTLGDKQIYLSTYLKLQIINYYFNNRFEIFYDKLMDTNKTRLLQHLSFETYKQEVVNINTKLVYILNSIGCTAKNCDAHKYGISPIVETKHEEKLDNNTFLKNNNIFRHHVILRPEIDLHNSKNHKQRSGDWLIYQRKDDTIRFLFLWQHPDNILINVAKYNSVNKLKPHQYMQNIKRKVKEISKIVKNKSGQNVKNISCKIQHDLIAELAQEVLTEDYNEIF